MVLHHRTEKLFVLIIAILLFPLSLYAQNKAFAKEVIDSLASPYFSGRGYVDSGDRRAAHYIRHFFAADSLHTLQGLPGFFQPYSMPINTFPGKMLLYLQGKRLVPGQDFLVDAASPSIKGNFVLVAASNIIDHHFKPKKKIHYAVVFSDESQKKNFADKQSSFHPDVTITLKEKLIWTASMEQSKVCCLEIKKSAFDSTAQTMTADIKAKFIPHYLTQNVAGYVPGSAYPDSFILFTAHYDHLGRMGADTYFPGANDNASGTAMLLNLAHYYSLPTHRPLYSVMFVAFSAEEAGLVGSYYFTTHPPIPLNHIAFVINMDLMANGQDGIMVVNGTVFTRAFALLDSLNATNHYLKTVKKRGKAANSDHYWFSEKGVHAFFVYLLGKYPWYHDIYDTPEKPTLAGYNGAFQLLTAFVKRYCK